MFINVLPVIAVILLVVWFAVDNLASQYFMALMNKYDVPVDDIHQMFLTSIHFYLIWAAIIAVVLAFILSFVLTRRVLRPLSQMATITREVSAGNYSLRADVQSRDEVGELGEAFNQMADNLEKVEKLRKAMVSDVAHELRTPLTNLRGYLEGLNDGVLPPSPDIFAMLQQENLRLVDLVSDLQQLARADAAKAFLTRESLLLSDLVNRLLTLHQLNFQNKKIHVERAFSKQEHKVSADQDKILQALQNLLDNAYKYTPPGGWVKISIGPVGEVIKVAFENSGEGIALEDIPFIFERFFRTDRSRSRDGGGAGIGLAITKELIEAHQGRVGAESIDGITRIWFELPV